MKMGKKQVAFTLKELKPLGGDDKRRVEMVYRESDAKGYFDNNVTVSFLKDGALYLSTNGGEQAIYLYPAQVRQLKLMLDTVQI